MNKTSSEISNLRQVYSQGKLDEKEVSKNPIVQFELWMNEAINAEVQVMIKFLSFAIQHLLFSLCVCFSFLDDNL